MKLYQYPNCSTCRKAAKFLKEKNIEVESIDITINPPTVDELQQMMSVQGDRKKLFNTSGVQYRELDMKAKLPNLSDLEAMKLLNGNGKLIKRPFLIGESIALVGFKEEQWKEAL
jgi:Spx/MgsR family transcriptional regulator